MADAVDFFGNKRLNEQCTEQDLKSSEGTKSKAVMRIKDGGSDGDRDRRNKKRKRGIFT